MPELGDTGVEKTTQEYGGAGKDYAYDYGTYLKDLLSQIDAIRNKQELEEERAEEEAYNAPLGERNMGRLNALLAVRGLSETVRETAVINKIRDYGGITKQGKEGGWEYKEGKGGPVGDIARALTGWQPGVKAFKGDGTGDATGVPPVKTDMKGKTWQPVKAATDLLKKVGSRLIDWNQDGKAFGTVDNQKLISTPSPVVKNTNQVTNNQVTNNQVTSKNVNSKVIADKVADDLAKLNNDATSLDKDNIPFKVESSYENVTGNKAPDYLYSPVMADINADLPADDIWNKNQKVKVNKVNKDNKEYRATYAGKYADELDRNKGKSKSVDAAVDAIKKKQNKKKTVKKTVKSNITQLKKDVKVNKSAKKMEKNAIKKQNTWAEASSLAKEAGHDLNRLAKDVKKLKCAERASMQKLINSFF